MHLKLSIEASKYLLLKERLLSEYLEADEDTLRDTLEGITNLHEMIAAVIRSALVDEAFQAGLRTRLEEMRLAPDAARGARRQEAPIGAGGDVRGRAEKARAARLHRLSPGGSTPAGRGLRGTDPSRLLGASAAQA